MHHTGINGLFAFTVSRQMPPLLPCVNASVTKAGGHPETGQGKKRFLHEIEMPEKI
jgi:hypothetical protein